MFGSLERRLALFNITVVVAVVAVTGLTTWLLLQKSLEHEANSVLKDRIDQVEASLGKAPDLAAIAGQPPTTAGNDDHDDHEDHDLLKSGDVLVVVMDPDGRVVSNPRGLDLPAIPVQPGLRSALDGEKTTQFLVIDGERMRVRTEPIEHDDHVYGAIQAMRSERQHDAELRLVGLISLGGATLGVVVALPAGLWLTRRALRPIEHAFARQRSFIAEASHELRTPLALVRANTELVIRTPELTATERSAELRAILAGVDSMSALVDTLLDLGRIEEDPRLALGPTPVRPIVARLLQELRPHANHKQLSLTADVADVSAIANETVLYRILRILLENAIAYTPAGGLVRVTGTANADRIMLTVCDTGPGIPETDRPYVFERFYRGEVSRHLAEGAGLGLAIASALVQTLHGSISLEAADYPGAVFQVTLPRARAGSHAVN